MILYYILRMIINNNVFDWPIEIIIVWNIHALNLQFYVGEYY